ncbi:CPBP family intramembrane metalloprotease [Rhodovulum tesquicola]|uniref:CPBP family intramembrane glutamic endopeptidase n=1 Tax=Rhodovulum tesquicola TaxID=540254 RepID=UPI002096BDC7|nr:CPBP family intramembrane glutamic endopeptidase [Rhodovulum tesquicola]MCO8144746.1 CPBP family intramembrane metalloprotease [Rhodovulum tesquicola]
MDRGTMDYRPHHALTRAARARPQLWRLVAGGLTAVAIHIGLIYAAYGLVAALRGTAFADSTFAGVFGTTLTAANALWLLASFVFLGIGTLVAASTFHGRGLISLTGPPGRAAAGFLRVLGALALLYAVLWVALPMGDDLQPNLDPGRWLILLPLAVGLVLVQVGAEELLFRGYLQQQLAARFRTPLIWIGLPAALFALGHYQPGVAGGNALALAAWAGLFAVAAADLTARSGTLGPAIALHFANNAVAILIVALPGPVSGLALYTYPFAPDDPALGPMFLVELGVLGLSWLAARVALRV